MFEEIVWASAELLYSVLEETAILLGVIFGALFYINRNGKRPRTPPKKPVAPKKKLRRHIHK